MTRDEFKSIRHRLGYSQAALSRVIGMRELTIRRYEMPDTAANHRQISESIAQFMRLIDYLGRDKIDRIMAEIDPGD